MITEKEMLDKIKWDNRYDPDTISVGYYDGVRDKIIFRPFDHIIFEKGNKFSFITYINLERKEIPFHRIRQIKERGKVIWKRKM